MTTVAQYIQDKDHLSGVSMIRLVYSGGYWDYTRWKFSEQNMFFFNDDMKVGHMLWLRDTLSIVDDNKLIINVQCNTKQIIALELFYGGAIL